MMQGHLFESPLSVGIERSLRAPIAAKADPDTSALAAKEITESGQREGQCMGVLALVRKYPESTSMELAHKGRTYDRHLIAKRLADLEHGGLVRKTGKKQCGVSGKKACTWRAN